MASQRTHYTAVVLIPREPCWEPIQAIRRRHDRQFRRWMPHVTLLYPFRPRELFDQVAGELAEAVAGIEPFEVTLRDLRHFRHGRSSYTIWFAPEPADAVRRLQSMLQSVVPDCGDVSRHAGGFTPHLSVGQARGDAALSELTETIRAGWSPLRFVVTRVSLIWRGSPPDEVFRVDRHVGLGAVRRA